MDYEDGRYDDDVYFFEANYYYCTLKKKEFQASLRKVNDSWWYFVKDFYKLKNACLDDLNLMSIYHTATLIPHKKSYEFIVDDEEQDT